MARFKFKGFTTASAVALLVSQNANEVGGSVESWQTTNGASVDIELDSRLISVAPAQVWLKAVNHSGLAAFDDNGTVYDGAHHEYFHVWSINGKPLSAFSAPVNMVTGWNNPNVAYGREVAFCLTEPGNYVIDLWVVDKNGVTASKSTETITVVDSAEMYPGAGTICVAQDGDFTGAPSGAVEILTMQALENYLKGNAGPFRVLFKRGQVYDFDNMTSAYWLRLPDAREVEYIGAFGSGAKPILKDPSEYVRSNGKLRDSNGLIAAWDASAVLGLTVTDVDFQGDFDPAAETGAVGQTCALDTRAGANLNQW